MTKPHGWIYTTLRDVTLGGMPTLDLVVKVLTGLYSGDNNPSESDVLIFGKLDKMGDRKQVSFATLRAKNQITLPAEISRAAHLSEGDPIEVRYFNGVITLVPKKMVDASQAWFWGPDWLQGEREASSDVARGNVRRFESDEDFLKALE